MTILEAAQYDPLRAQEIEANLNQIWWKRYEIYKRESTKIAKADERKARRR